MTNVDPKIREEIRTKQAALRDNPMYPTFKQTAVLHDLKTIGDVYSFWIENPGLRKTLLHGKGEETVKKMALKGIRAVKDGWYYLHQLSKSSQPLAYLNIPVIERLNGIIEPRVSGTGKLRKKDVTLNIRGYTPPSWERVPERLKQLIDVTLEIYEQDPLEAAINFHLGTAMIQPFIEGNKRCARLVQDRILWDAKLPPVVIPAGEGTFYFDLLCRIAPEYQAGNLEGQKQFFDYCASKVNNGLDAILGDLSAGNHIRKIGQ